MESEGRAVHDEPDQLPSLNRRREWRTI